MAEVSGGKNLLSANEKEPLASIAGGSFSFAAIP